MPTVGEPLLASAGQLSEDLQGLRQQNALLRAHLRRLSQAQEVLLQSESEVPWFGGAGDRSMKL